MSCKRLNIESNQGEIFNLLVHGLLLFTILSALYLLVISKMETNAFQTEINAQLTDKLPQLISQIDTTGSIKSSLKNMPLSNFNSLFSQPSAQTTLTNKSLQTSMGWVIFTLLILIISGGLWLKLSCDQCVNFWSIIKQNLLIFLFVGIAEGVFFYFIASKYVPVPPSLLINTTIGDLKNTWTSLIKLFGYE